MTMGRYSRKQSACAGKESAEDFGKRREDQREISAHLQLNYANTPPCGCAGVTFLFSLIHPLYEPFVCFPIIWITHLNYPVQLDYANTSPFRCVGVTFLLAFIRPLYKSLLASYCLDYPFQPDYAKFPRANAGEFCILFSPSAGVLYIIFYFHYTKILWGFRSYQLPKTIWFRKRSPVQSLRNYFLSFLVRPLHKLFAFSPIISTLHKTQFCKYSSMCLQGNNYLPFYVSPLY